MAEERIERKIAVILATDVVGYSTKIEANEEQTIQTLRACREIIEGLIAEHHGRIFNTAGDSVLAEFPSAVEAVLCASDFQRTIKERNASVEDEAQQMEFRVGINMGDVVIEESNLYGEGVNVAARLEALSQPGGICLSKNVHEVVHKKMDLRFTDLGDQQVKDTVVHAVDVSLDGVAQRKLPGTMKAKSSAHMAYLVAGLAIVALIVVGGLWWWQAQSDVKPADATKLAYQIPKKPSLVVLPFDNLSGDPAKDYIGDGFTENLIAVLSTDPQLFVIARTSSFTYKGKATTVQEVAEQLGVRYVLDGSIQQSGETLRITTQLVDTVKGKQLWTERYDRQLSNLFALQDDVTDKIYEAMQVELTLREQVRLRLKYAGSPELMRKVMKVRTHWMAFSLNDHREAVRLLEELHEMNPENGIVLNWMGWVEFQKLMMRLSKNPKQTLLTTRQYAEKAYAITKTAGPLALLAWVDLFFRDYDGALVKARRVAEINPSGSETNAIAAEIQNMAGEPGEASVLFKRSMRLGPHYPEWIPVRLAFSLLQQGVNDEAQKFFAGVVATGESVRQRVQALEGLAASSIFKKEIEKAQGHVKELLKLNPSFSVGAAKGRNGLMKDQAYLKRYLEALRQAGLPEKGKQKF